MQMSHNECQELKARYEEASSETQAKHEEVLQNLQKMLLDAGERLKAAQKENSDLLQETEELRRQADKARVRRGENRVVELRFACVPRQGCKGAWKAAARGMGSVAVTSVGPQGAWQEGELHFLYLQVLCTSRCSFSGRVMATGLSPECTVWPPPPALLAPQLSRRVCCCLTSVCLPVVDSLLREGMFL